MGGRSFPDQSPQGLSGHAESRHGRGWYSFPSIAPQVLICPGRASNGRWGADSQTCPSLGRTAMKEGGQLPQPTPEGLACLGRPTVEEEGHLPQPGRPSRR